MPGIARPAAGKHHPRCALSVEQKVGRGTVSLHHRGSMAANGLLSYLGALLSIASLTQELKVPLGVCAAA